MYGNNENLEALSFLREMNQEVYASFKGVQTIAEESTAFSGVTKPVHFGGLGFGMKWMMGWMHDTLEFFKKEPIHRSYDLNDITFSMTYAFTENFVLPFSHDEVVYGKQSLLYRMPADEWQRFANLRLLFGYMFTHPGGNLLFMGGEFGQSSEWNFQESLAWHLTQYDFHSGIQEVIKDLNKLYKSNPALYQKQFSSEGFQWIEYNDKENTVITYLRKGEDPKDDLIIACNFTPVPRENYRVGVPKSTQLKLVFNSDETKYSGSGIGKKTLKPSKTSWNGHPQSVVMTLPPLAVVVYK
jgi:1,4-alpha-glucan branching enzyme